MQSVCRTPYSHSRLRSPFHVANVSNRFIRVDRYLVRDTTLSDSLMLKDGYEFFQLTSFYSF